MWKLHVTIKNWLISVWCWGNCLAVGGIKRDFMCWSLTRKKKKDQTRLFHLSRYGRLTYYSQTLCWLKLKILNKIQKKVLLVCEKKVTKDKELSSQSLSEQGTWRKQSRKLLLPQEHLPNQGILSLSVQPSNCGEEKRKPKTAKMGVQWGPTLSHPPSVGGWTRRNQLHPPQCLENARYWPRCWTQRPWIPGMLSSAPLWAFSPHSDTPNP